MNVAVNIHDTVSIKKYIKFHDGFTTYSLVITDKSGVETCVTCYGQWDNSAITVSDVEIIDYREKK